MLNYHSDIIMCGVFQWCNRCLYIYILSTFQILAISRQHSLYSDDIGLYLFCLHHHTGHSLRKRTQAQRSNCFSDIILLYLLNLFSFPSNNPFLILITVIFLVHENDGSQQWCSLGSMVHQFILSDDFF